MGMKESIDNLNEPAMAPLKDAQQKYPIDFYVEKPIETETSMGKVSNAKDMAVKSTKEYLKTNES